VPAVHASLSFARTVADAAKADIALFCYEGDGTRPLAGVLKEKRVAWTGEGVPTVAIVIGSEGGFSLAEAEAARAAGLIPVGLGKRILRTETAAAFVLACLVYEMELQ
jgi:16S rRNA (uracil1498-N3)-methyltransferase